MSPPTVTASHGRGPTMCELAKILQRTFDRRRQCGHRDFAVGRTRELLYFIREIKGKEPGHRPRLFPVYIDSR